MLQLGRLSHLEGRLQDSLDEFEGARKLASPSQLLEIDLRRSFVYGELGDLERARKLTAFASASWPQNEPPPELANLFRMAVTAFQNAKYVSDLDESKAVADANRFAEAIVQLNQAWQAEKSDFETCAACFGTWWLAPGYRQSKRSACLD